jgi:hypothetical protein
VEAGFEDASHPFDQMIEFDCQPQALPLSLEHAFIK